MSSGFSMFENIFDVSQLKWYTSLSAYVNEHEQLNGFVIY